MLLLGKISLNSCRFLYIDLPHKKWFIGSNNKLDHLKQNNLTKLPITKGKFITHPYLIWNIDIKKITQLPPWAKSLKKSIKLNNNFNFKMKRKTVLVEFDWIRQFLFGNFHLKISTDTRGYRFKTIKEKVVIVTRLPYSRFSMSKCELTVMWWGFF